MRHRFVPNLGGLEHRFLLIKAYPTGSGSSSPPQGMYAPPDPPDNSGTQAPTDPSSTDPSNTDPTNGSGS